VKQYEDELQIYQAEIMEKDHQIEILKGHVDDFKYTELCDSEYISAEEFE